MNISADHSSVQYSCDVGYTLNGQVSQVCQTGGKGWSGVVPICGKCMNQIGCHKWISKTFSYEGFCCNLNVSLKILVVCAAKIAFHWRWLGLKTTFCLTSALCASVPHVSGGSVSLSSDGQITTATYKCSVGYSMDGPPTSRCRVDGSWNTTGTTCGTEASHTSQFVIEI